MTDEAIGHDRLLSTDEVATRWRVNPRTVSRIAARGGLQRIKIGHQVRFQLSAILEYEQADRTSKK